MRVAINAAVGRGREASLLPSWIPRPPPLRLLLPTRSPLSTGRGWAGPRRRRRGAGPGAFFRVPGPGVSGFRSLTKYLSPLPLFARIFRWTGPCGASLRPDLGLRLDFDADFGRRASGPGPGRFRRGASSARSEYGSGRSLRCRSCGPKGRGDGSPCTPCTARRPRP